MEGATAAPEVRARPGIGDGEDEASSHSTQLDLLKGQERGWGCNNILIFRALKSFYHQGTGIWRRTQTGIPGLKSGLEMPGRVKRDAIGHLVRRPQQLEHRREARGVVAL